MPMVDINHVQKEAEQEINSVADLTSLGQARVKYLGRQGIISGLFAEITALSKEEKAVFGRQLNTLKQKLDELIRDKESFLKQAGAEYEMFDVTLPGVITEIGQLHPLTQILREICAIFIRMGFSVVEGPEIETEENNFTGLNIPPDHPSRDAFDTFYIKDVSGLRSPVSGQNRRQAIPLRAQAGDRRLLRSHTSPAQIRVMKSLKPPLAVVVPGKVYRPDATDASHSFMFHQVEGFLVDKNIRFSDLKGVLDVFAKNLFGDEVKTRFRPHFFPFTEPSAEVDVSCIICKSPVTSHQSPENKEKKCSVCGGKGWLEILGSGMIHPNVFKHVGYDPETYTGFAFGMGVERIAMLKYGISDIRMFFENDLRFLKQF
ncbi:MAG: phenylalanine--tRNA ligase subunit alpha [Candidatus Omnitrophota bacterium]|nr:phenylalanine--tRNA ligase subunit alpha [Candidatus Omnitrophota bacterium]